MPSQFGTFKQAQRIQQGKSYSMFVSMNPFIPIISEIPVEDLMKSKEALDLYEKENLFLYTQVKEMNVNMYLVEQIISFHPIFIEEWLPDRWYFLGSFIENALYMSILIMNKVISDSAEDIVSIPSFQQKILKEYLKPEHQDFYRKVLKGNKEGKKQINEIQKKAKEFRDKRIAHLTKHFFQQSFDKTMQQSRFNFREIRELSWHVNSMFSSCVFGRGIYFLPSCYQHPQRDRKTDIEAFLDNIAQNSEILNLPETEPERWKVKKATLKKEELHEINRYRKKFNLEMV